MTNNVHWYMYIILIIFLLAVVGFVGYKVYQHIKNDKMIYDPDAEWNKTLEEMKDSDEIDDDLG